MSNNLNLKMPEELVERLDALVAEVERAKVVGTRVTRHSVALDALELGLGLVQRKLKRAKRAVG